EPISPHRLMASLALDVIAEVLVGAGILAHRAVIEKSIEVFLTRFEAMMSSALPIPLHVPTPANLHARWVLRSLDTVIFNIIAKRRKEQLKGNDVLGFLLKKAPELTDRQMRDDLVGLLFAGHETSALTMGWALHLLA